MKRIPLYLLTTFFLVISLFLLAEFWQIGILNETDGYAWGPTNENPWHYASPELYAKTMLFEGMVLLLMSIFALRSNFINNKSAVYWSGSCVLFLVVMFYSATVRRCP